MFLQDVINVDAMPALEMAARFAAQRQRVTAHNIANISTPEYLQQDLSVAEFRETLADAVDRRRQTSDGLRGPLEWRETNELRRDARGHLVATPTTPSGNILFHDRNNRDLERLMQDQVENVGVFRIATELMRTHTEMMRAAIAGRI
ncbi:MAG: hypothetical protein EA379_09800 [Phycisphaerales bacterium]|nr:MAG: hypothetical protein EA379_09800 [Phycisphaerales bacterium]